MDTNTYLTLLNANNTLELTARIDKLTWSERIHLREKLEAIKCNKLIRSLYYDYKLQEWIEL